MGRCSPHEKIGVPNSKDNQTLLVPTDVCKADWGVLITHAAVTYSRFSVVKMHPLLWVVKMLSMKLSVHVGAYHL